MLLLQPHSCISHCIVIGIYYWPLQCLLFVCMHVIVNHCMKWLNLKRPYPLATWYLTFSDMYRINWASNLASLLHTGCFCIAFCGLILLHYVITAYWIFETMQVMWYNQRAEIKQLFTVLQLFTYTYHHKRMGVRGLSNTAHHEQLPMETDWGY